MQRRSWDCFIKFTAAARDRASLLTAPGPDVRPYCSADARMAWASATMACQVVGAPEALGVELVDILGSRGPGGEPALGGGHLRPPMAASLPGRGSFWRVWGRRLTLPPARRSAL